MLFWKAVVCSGYGINEVTPHPLTKYKINCPNKRWFSSQKHKKSLEFRICSVNGCRRVRCKFAGVANFVRILFEIAANRGDYFLWLLSSRFQRCRS